MDFSKAEASFTKLKRQMENLSSWKPENIHTLDLDYVKKLTQQFYGDLMEASTASPLAKPKNPYPEVKTTEKKAPKIEEKEAIHKVNPTTPKPNTPVKEIIDTQSISTSPKPTKPKTTSPEPAPISVQTDEKVINENKASIPNDRVDVINPSMKELFDLPSSSDLSDLLRNRKIDHIGNAMGFNEKIFTVNELFNGDRALFDATIDKLNAMDSFEDAKSYLMNHVIESLEWSSEKKIKSAQNFIRHISRKYQQVEA